MMFFVLSFFVSFIFAYQSFPEKIRTEIISGKANEELEYYTPSTRFILTITSYDSSKTEIYVASPSQSSLLEIGEARAFYFPYGNSKLIIKFIQDSSIIVNYASLTDTICSSGINVIINETNTAIIDASEQLIDKCYFFAYASERHQYKVTANGLLEGSRICTYHDFINENPYSCYSEGTSISSSFEPGGGSKSPWLLRLTTTSEASTSKSNQITFELRATIINNSYTPATYFGEPQRFNQPLIDKYHQKIWIPIIGAISPLFLLISWLYTFIHLYRKRSDFRPNDDV